MHTLTACCSAMWGICGEVSLDVYIFGSGYLLSGPGGFSFEFVRAVPTDIGLDRGLMHSDSCHGIFI